MPEEGWWGLLYAFCSVFLVNIKLPPKIKSINLKLKRQNANDDEYKNLKIIEIERNFINLLIHAFGS